MLLEKLLKTPGFIYQIKGTTIFLGNGSAKNVQILTLQTVS